MSRTTIDTQNEFFNRIEQLVRQTPGTTGGRWAYLARLGPDWELEFDLSLDAGGRPFCGHCGPASTLVIKDWAEIVSPILSFEPWETGEREILAWDQMEHAPVRCTRCDRTWRISDLEEEIDPR